MSRKLEYTKRETVNTMVASLRAVAKERGVSLNGLTIDNFNYFLDDAFNDGGEVRCELFGDLAWNYALQFGPLESGPFDSARWECTEAAIKRIGGA